MIPKKEKGSFAFTLIEVLVVLVIVAVLVVVTFPNFRALQLKAEGIVCTGRLRNLWAVFSTTLNDGDGWPQVPTNIPIGSPEEQKWWLNYSSNNLGLTLNDWQCPSIVRQGRSNPKGNTNLISYLPTLFDAKPQSPKNWPRMPWFTETQGLHGAGILSVRADGSVCPIQDP